MWKSGVMATAVSAMPVASESAPYLSDLVAPATS